MEDYITRAITEDETTNVLGLTFHEDPVETRSMMIDAVKPLSALAYVRAFRPSGAHPIFVHSAARPLIHALNQRILAFLSFLAPVIDREAYIYDIYLRGVGVTFVGALKKGYLIARGDLESVVTVLRCWDIALVHLQPAYIDIHTDEFPHPSARKEAKTNGRVHQNINLLRASVNSTSFYGKRELYTNPGRTSGGFTLTLYEMSQRRVLQEKYGMVHQPL